MILLTRLSGDEIYLNPDLIERIETAPDTIVALVDGKRYAVAEQPQELIRRIIAFRASVLVMAENGTFEAAGAVPSSVSSPRALFLIEDSTED